MAMSTKRRSLLSWTIGLVSCLLVLALVPVSARAEDVDSDTGGDPLAGIVLEDDNATVASGQTNDPNTLPDDTGDQGQVPNDAAGTAAVGDAPDAAQGAEDVAPKNLGLEVAPPSEGVVVEQTNEAQDVEQQDGDAIEVLKDDALPQRNDAGVSLSAQSDASQTVRIAYRSHVADGEWSPYAYDGTVLQSIGSDGCIDGLRIKVVPGNTGVTGGVAYRMHVAKKGWLDWAQDGARGGAGKGLRIEALQIKLTGSLADQYDVYYSVYLQGKGWMKWAKNGATTGSVGMALRIEGIRVRLVTKGAKAPSSKHVMFKSVLLEGSPVSVMAKMKGQGWLPAVSNNMVAGVTGQKQLLQGLKVTLPSAKVPGSVRIKGHIQGTGWTELSQDKVTTSGSKRLEAIALKLSGEAAKKYDIYYRTHVSRLGWLAWVKNGKYSGTRGLSLPIEAVQVYVVKKGAVAPSNDSTDVPYYAGSTLRYRAYCQTYRWRKEVKSGEIAGTVGEGKRMEAMKMRLAGGNVPGDVNYDVFVAGSGWQGGVSNNAVAGTMGQSTALQAIKVSLGGLANSMYDVWYRVHLNHLGWLGWAKNGEVAGAPRMDKKIEAIEVRLLPKDAAAPGSTTNHLIDVAGQDAQMLMRAQGYSSPTQWLILVDVDNTRLAVFRGSKNNWRFYDSWGISCGAPTSPTVRGVFSVGDRGYVFGHGYSCYYYTQFYGGYLFHSIKYYEGTFSVMDGRIGEHISMGCVRMNIDRAKWIYDNIPYATTVVTY